VNDLAHCARRAANAYRHASASRISIEVRLFATRLHVVVADNGDGITGVSPSSQRPSSRAGVGILGIRIRLTQLGGRLRITEPTNEAACRPADGHDRFSRCPNSKQ
jgi:glucose-6-phosphate-specific signal transduction histidine kinase